MKNLKNAPRADKMLEKWDVKSVGPPSPSLRGDPPWSDYILRASHRDSLRVQTF